MRSEKIGCQISKSQISSNSTIIIAEDTRDTILINGTSMILQV